MENGEVVGVRGIMSDISQRKEAEAQLLSYQEQLRALGTELTLVEERERRRIAAELHDQIGQNLALGKLKVAALEKGATAKKLKSELSAVRRLLEVSIRDARSLIFDLSPPVLYELGFPAALEWLTDWIGEQYRVPVEFENRAGEQAMESDRQVRIRIELPGIARENVSIVSAILMGWAWCLGGTVPSIVGELYVRLDHNASQTLVYLGFANIGMVILGFLLPKIADDKD